MRAAGRPASPPKRMELLASPRLSMLGPRGFHCILARSFHADRHNAGNQIQAGQSRTRPAANQAGNARLGRPARAAHRRFAGICLALRAVHRRRPIRHRDFLSLSQRASRQQKRRQARIRRRFRTAARRQRPDVAAVSHLRPGLLQLPAAARSESRQGLGGTHRAASALLHRSDRARCRSPFRRCCGPNGGR